ncbi:MAG: hypothetical protein HS115_19385 [Spirochaetales bacterium]|nr:hypothetical protein [Spirochaetales bacterium]
MSLLIVFKRSKWERDLEFYGSVRALERIYTIQNQAKDRILSSHERQKEALGLLRRELPQATFYSRADLLSRGAAGFFALAGLGGDNHFVHISRQAGSALLAGINSDPETSSGNLLYFSAETFLRPARLLCEGRMPDDLLIEEWPGLTGYIVLEDGSRIDLPHAVSEISIRSAFPEHVSRCLIDTGDGKLYEQKSSGLLLATGTGSTGWFMSAGGSSFPRTEKTFRYLLREPMALHEFPASGTIEKQGVLRIISEMDGLINIDAEKNLCFDFPQAAVATFVLSRALRILKPITSAS